MASWLPRWSGDGNNLQPPADDGPSRMSASDRPGKFRELSEFMKVDHHDTTLQQRYQSIGFTNIRPDMIVHIADERSRLDRRVMLVLRKSSMSFMCLTFCSHGLPPAPEDHWRVCEEGNISVKPGDNEKMKPLEVILTPHGRSSPKVAPEPGITVNIQDIWNVENEVVVKVLGEVVPGALSFLSKAVKELFCQNLDQVIPTLVTPTTSQSPTRKEERERKDSKTEYFVVRVPSKNKKKPLRPLES